MKVLVLGGAGYIGSHTVWALLQKNISVVVADNLETGHREALFSEAAFYEGDIRDRSFIDSVFESETDIDAVIHFAANSLVGESMTNPLKYYDNNVYGTKVLLESMVAHNVKNIVFSSTAAVYGEPKQVPITEESELNPKNTYGETKRAMEQMFAWASKAYSLNYVSLRYFNACGALLDGSIGEAHATETHLIPLTLLAALGKRPSISVYGEDYETEDGTCIRDYIHVLDLAQAHIKAVEYLLNGGESNCFNLGSGLGYSVREIIETAKKVTGIDIPVTMGERRAGDPAILVASSEKAKRVLGWKPEYDSIETIIKSAWTWHRSHPDAYQTTPDRAIRALVAYGLDKKLIEPEDANYVTNQILMTLGMDAIGEEAAGSAGMSGGAGIIDGAGMFGNIEMSGGAKNVDLEQIMKVLLDYAAHHGLLKDNTTLYRDLFDTKLMGLLTPRPSEVNKEFSRFYQVSPELATNYFYKLSKDCDYIRTYRVAKDIRWVSSNEYGDIDITINRSKPEKDPKAIAAALTAKKISYPKCQLCVENVGYAGRETHPARETLRMVPVTLKDQQWYLQYSPYVYYNEHCIVLKEDHHPMTINQETFEKLLEFVGKFPHYFIGSNADLPIVGGSILTHEHFQGGNYTFAMAKAAKEAEYSCSEYPDVSVARVKWPMSVLRLSGTNPEHVAKLGEKIRRAWKTYSNEKLSIAAVTESYEGLAAAKVVEHNTITPIARNINGVYELDLVLRNNGTSKEYPDGIFHPHAEHHHIKKENIGLIEVMGLAILPARLLTEMEPVKELLCGAKLEQLNEEDRKAVEKHLVWAEQLCRKYGVLSKEAAAKAVEDEIGEVFTEILEQAGVFKRNEEGMKAFDEFVKEALGSTN